MIWLWRLISGIARRSAFPQSLEYLGPGEGDCERAQLLDSSLATNNAVKQGYVFRYTPGHLVNTRGIPSFSITATPITPGSTGLRYFYTDETGLIRWSTSGAADGKSRVLR
jgi:hypothetical protein